MSNEEPAAKKARMHWQAAAASVIPLFSGGRQMSEASGSGPSAVDYTRWGISVAGLRRVAATLCPQLGAADTTSDVCHAAVKPATVPAGWSCAATVTDAARRWYSHEYTELASGRAQKQPPAGTRSYCEVLDADPATCELVGRPTHFLSHAWTHRFEDVVEALALREEESEDDGVCFYWFDCFSLDEHATQVLPQDFWSDTFKEAIRMIGRTVMVLSPWDKPVALTRAWCLWELFCSVEGGSSFEIALPPAERRAFEVALAAGYNSVHLAFANIDVEQSKAGQEDDEVMIKQQVVENGGYVRLNSVAIGAVRQWVVQLGRAIIHERSTDGKIHEDALGVAKELAMLLLRDDQLTEAGRLIERLVDSAHASLGPDHEITITAELRQGQLLLKTHQYAAATTVIDRVVAAATAQLGEAHAVALEAGRSKTVLLYAAIRDANWDAYMADKHGLDPPATGSWPARVEDFGLAIEMADQLLAVATGRWGSAHYETLQCRLSRADILQVSDQWDTAVAELQEVHAGMTALPNRGPGHPSTLAVALRRAQILALDKRPGFDSEQAVAELLPVIDGLTKLEGLGGYGARTARMCHYDLLLACDPDAARQVTKEIVDGLEIQEKVGGRMKASRVQNVYENARDQLYRLGQSGPGSAEWARLGMRLLAVATKQAARSLPGSYIAGQLASELEAAKRDVPSWPAVFWPDVSLAVAQEALSRAKDKNYGPPAAPPAAFDRIWSLTVARDERRRAVKLYIATPVLCTPRSRRDRYSKLVDATLARPPGYMVSISAGGGEGSDGGSDVFEAGSSDDDDMMVGSDSE